MAASTSSAKSQASAAARRAKDEIAEGAEDVVARARTTGRRVRAEAEEIGDDLARGADDLVETVSNKLRSAGIDPDRMADAAREQASDLQELLMREVQERPLRALGLAAAVGLFVGFLSAR